MKILPLFFILFFVYSCGNKPCDIPEMTFSHIVDERDSSYYRTVTISMPIEKGAEPTSSTWFLENLRYRNTKNCQFGYSCVNGCSYSFYPEYPDSICPKGWHIATEKDWTTLLKQINNLSRTETHPRFEDRSVVVYENTNNVQHPMAYLFIDEAFYSFGEPYEGWMGGDKDTFFHVHYWVEPPKENLPLKIAFYCAKIYRQEKEDAAYHAAKFCRCVKNK